MSQVTQDVIARVVDGQLKTASAFSLVPKAIGAFGKALGWATKTPLRTTVSATAGLVAGNSAINAAAPYVHPWQAAKSIANDAVGMTVNAGRAGFGKTPDAPATTTPPSAPAPTTGGLSFDYTKPMGEWGAGQYGGLGAGALLTYMLTRRDDDQE